jgi:hypothetical protein
MCGPDHGVPGVRHPSGDRDLAPLLLRLARRIEAGREAGGDTHHDRLRLQCDDDREQVVQDAGCAGAVAVVPRGGLRGVDGAVGASGELGGEHRAIPGVGVFHVKHTHATPVGSVGRAGSEPLGVRPSLSQWIAPLCAVRSRTVRSRTARAASGFAPRSRAGGPSTPAPSTRRPPGTRGPGDPGRALLGELSWASSPGPGAGGPGIGGPAACGPDAVAGFNAAARAVIPDAGRRTPGRRIRAGRPRHGHRTATPAGLHRECRGAAIPPGASGCHLGRAPQRRGGARVGVARTRYTATRPAPPRPPSAGGDLDPVAVSVRRVRDRDAADPAAWADHPGAASAGHPLTRPSPTRCPTPATTSVAVPRETSTPSAADPITCSTETAGDSRGPQLRTSHATPGRTPRPARRPSPADGHSVRPSPGTHHEPIHARPPSIPGEFRHTYD